METEIRRFKKTDDGWLHCVVSEQGIELLLTNKHGEIIRSTDLTIKEITNYILEQ